MKGPYLNPSRMIIWQLESACVTGYATVKGVQEYLSLFGWTACFVTFTLVAFYYQYSHCTAVHYHPERYCVPYVDTWGIPAFTGPQP